MEACRPALLKHGIWLTQITVPAPDNFAQDHIALFTKLTHAESGQWQSCLTIVPLPKPNPQGMGSAITYARRYALTAMLGIVTEDDDGEAAKYDPQVATANSNGAGDDTGLYQGVQRQNAAFLDRFILCEMGYPEAQIKQKLIKSKFPVLPEDLCDKMVDYANEVRKLFMGEAVDILANTIEVTFSTRSLLRWAALTVRYQPIAYALNRALAYRASRKTVTVQIGGDSAYTNGNEIHIPSLCWIAMKKW